ncbi:hypothetical protein PULV_a2515 [Pseudoalteromonas ulvae UL12]|uniref:MBL fold metallo-hydrolase n=1 Tax=Pseudoalteromonas ulvae TaxID=107327 RepID=UPI00186B8594|nr:hypothetical protein [Pseudoalteromonas ulvae UL12]
MIKKSLLAMALTSLTAMSYADEVQIKTEQLTDNIHVLFGQGGNIAASVGDDGIYIIDDQFAKLSDKIKQTISNLKPGSAEFVINTHHHGDHTGGNENFANAGSHVIAHDNVHKRLVEKHGEDSKYVPVLSFSHNMSLHFNNEHAKIMHFAHAHTDGDAVVFFNKANVVHMGDIYFNLGGLPFVDVESGGSVNGVLAAVEAVISHTDEQTKIIPGHGPVSNQKELKQYHQLVTQAKEVMLTAMKDGASEEAVVAAKPLSVLNLQYSGWLPEERVTKLFYQSLSQKPHHH